MNRTDRGPIRSTAHAALNPNAWSTNSSGIVERTEMLPDWQSAELAAAARRGNPAAVSQAGEPKKLVVLHGFGHYEVYAGKAFRQVMAETVPWFHQYLR
jgi:hypothetical protein